MVNIGNRVVQKHGKHETDIYTAGKVNGLADGTLVDARAVAFVSEKMERATASTEAARTATVHWHDKT
jgi:hypothetical protein